MALILGRIVDDIFDHSISIARLKLWQCFVCSFRILNKPVTCLLFFCDVAALCPIRLQILVFVTRLGFPGCFSVDSMGIYQDRPLGDLLSRSYVFRAARLLIWVISRLKGDLGWAKNIQESLVGRWRLRTVKPMLISDKPRWFLVTEIRFQVGPVNLLFVNKVHLWRVRKFIFGLLQGFLLDRDLVVFWIFSYPLPSLGKVLHPRLVFSCDHLGLLFGLLCLESKSLASEDPPFFKTEISSFPFWF